MPYKSKKEDVAAILASIEKLGQLRKQGAITEEEFKAKKKELLRRLKPRPPLQSRPSPTEEQLPNYFLEVQKD